MAKAFMSDFTRQAEAAKSSLATEYRFVSRERAMKIISDMKSVLKDEAEWSALGDLGQELSGILSALPEFTEKHSVRSASGELCPVSLFTEGFKDGEKNRTVVREYEKYVKMLPTAAMLGEMIDEKFIQELDRAAAGFRSSSDYITRLVRRLLRCNFGYNGKFGKGDTTRLLILRQLLRQFGVVVNERINSTWLISALAEKFGLDITRISEPGELEKITDAAFALKDSPLNLPDVNTKELEKFIGAVSNVQGIIRIKGTLTCVSPEICSMICSLFREELLSPQAKNGTAEYLADCFAIPHYKISMGCLKDYRSLGTTNELRQLYEALRSRYQAGFLLYKDFSASVRLYTIMKSLPNGVFVPEKGKIIKALKEIYGKTAAFTDKPASNGGYILSKKFLPEKIEFVTVDEKYNSAVTALEALAMKQGCFTKNEYALAVAENDSKISGTAKRRAVSFRDAEPLYRLIVLLQSYAYKMPVSELPGLRAALPAISIADAQGARHLSDVLFNKKDILIDSINNMSLAASYENFRALTEYVTRLEALYVKNEKAYAEGLRDKTENRFNNYSKLNGTCFRQNMCSWLADKKADSLEYSFLEIADDLARGSFSSQKKTKEYLYIFAIAFDITERPDGSPDRITDVRSALFSDYYTDNIINCPDEPENPDSERHGVVIDGYGINYKNFAEVVYMWCLSQPDMTARQRFVTALEMIDECRTLGRTEDEFYDACPDKLFSATFTQECRSRFEALKRMPADTFLHTVIEEYPCRSDSSGPMQICDERITAGEVVSGFAKKLTGLLKLVERETVYDSDSREIESNNQLSKFIGEYNYLTKKRCGRCPKKSKTPFPECEKYFEPCTITLRDNTEVYYKDCGEFYSSYVKGIKGGSGKYASGIINDEVDSFVSENENFEKTFYAMKRLCPESRPALRRLLTRISDRLRFVYDEVVNPAYSGRSTIVAMCFYEAIYINSLARLIDDEAYMSFEEYYNRFVRGGSFALDLNFDPTSKTSAAKPKLFEYTILGADALLEQAGYQPVSSKNIFDIFLIYTAYRDMFSPFYKTQEDKFINFYKAEEEKFRKISRERMKEKK